MLTIVFIGILVFEVETKVNYTMENDPKNSVQDEQFGKIAENLNEVIRIGEETKNRAGLSLRIRLSYNRGFNRGLASMSSNLLNANSN